MNRFAKICLIVRSCALVIAVFCSACETIPEAASGQGEPPPCVSPAPSTTTVKVLDHAGRPAPKVTVSLVHPRAIGAIETAITDAEGVARFRYGGDAYVEARLEDPAQLLMPESIDLACYFWPGRDNVLRLARVKVGGVRLGETKPHYFRHADHPPGESTTCWEWTDDLAATFPDAWWVAYVGYPGQEVGPSSLVTLFVEGHAKLEVTVPVRFAEEVQEPTLVDLSTVPKAPWASFRLTFLDPDGTRVPESLSQLMLDRVILVQRGESPTTFRPAERIAGDQEHISVPAGEYEIRTLEGVSRLAPPCWVGRIDEATTAVVAQCSSALRPLQIEVHGLAGIDCTIHLRSRDRAEDEREYVAEHPASPRNRFDRKPHAREINWNLPVTTTVVAPVGTYDVWVETEFAPEGQRSEVLLVEILSDHETPPVRLQLDPPPTSDQRALMPNGAVITSEDQRERLNVKHWNFEKL